MLARPRAQGWFRAPKTPSSLWDDVDKEGENLATHLRLALTVTIVLATGGCQSDQRASPAAGADAAAAADHRDTQTPSDKAPVAEPTSATAKVPPSSPAPKEPSLRTTALPDESIAQEASYVFEFSPAQLGERYLLDAAEKTSMETRIKTAKEDVEEGKTETDAFTKLVITVMETKGGQMSRLRYRYLESKERQKDKGALQRFKAPVSGKTYLLERGGKGGLKVTYKGGGSPSRDEVAQIQRDAQLAEISERFFDLLPKRPLKPGEELEVKKDKLKAFIFPRGTVVLSVKKTKLNFKEARLVDGRKAGIFVVHLNAVVQEGPMTIDVSLSGEVALEIGRGRVLRLKWEGPVRIVGKTKDGEQEFNVAGTGQTTQSQLNIHQLPHVAQEKP